MLPPTYGRWLAGHASTIAIHEPDTASVTAPSTASRSSRPRTASRETARVATTSASANAGPGIHAASIFVLNATPTSAPASAHHAHQRRLSIDCSVAPAAPTSSSTMNGSGRLSRLTATEIGVSASVAPAIVAAAGPK